MRPRSQFPKIYLHKTSGRDAGVVRDPDGRRKTIYLGPAGSAESQRRYREVLAEHLAVKPATTARAALHAPSKWPSCGQLQAEYLLHARK